jgi:hypothetical protein
LDIKPIISKKKKKSYKRFSLAEYESNNKWNKIKYYIL